MDDDAMSKLAAALAEWEVAGVAASLLIATTAFVLVLRPRRLRRQGKQLAQEMRRAIEEGEVQQSERPR